MAAPAGKGKGGRGGARGLAKSYTFPLSTDLEDAKNEEPYAKLIYKALMSRSDYCMSLQDLYQWFRENTNKASDEKGGWQNSIRHNLSMNAAFTKRDQKQMADGSSTPSSAAAESGASQSQSATSSCDLKRVNEWVLEDWAVRDGVQSTTRYRKGGSTRKTASKYTSHPGGMGRRGGNLASNSNSNSNNYSLNCNNSMNAGQQQHSSTRALSGRKGGCATKVSRLRGQRFGSVGSGYGSPMRRSHYDQGMMHQGPDSPSGTGMVNPYFSVVPLSRLGPGLMQAPMSQISDDGTHFSPEATGSSSSSSSSPFGIHMGLGPHLAHGLVGAGGDPCGGGDGVGSVSTGGGAYLSHHEASGGSGSGSGSGSMYLTPSPVGEFPYGIADVQLSYPVDAHRGGEITATERFFSPLHGNVGDWAHHHGL
ncbi:Fork-head transcriptional regulator 2 [Escovopsis weberi]|uniref:Fork-head transcriptional regulator 2 n=1 Tax=Escovopsis weberi TaxID=150374 RepID=A0A0M8MSC1_ESCWE|nr:Fork-head transcriptional regulator 2 [Escovopsis weberi]